MGVAMAEKVALITGALKGLGFETARELAQQGYHVVLTGRDEVRGKDALARLHRQDLKAEYRVLDVASVRSIEQVCSSVISDLKRVDVLVNNAGVLHDDKSSLAGLASVIEQSFRTNSLGPYLMCEMIVPQMMRQGYGRVVNVSSGMGQLSEMNSGYPGYRLSKTALNAVTRIWADKTRGTNILVNSVCPGWVKTDMGGRGATRPVEKGAETIIWLATLPDGSPTGGFFRDKQPMAW